jgi:hypothetical protein
MTTLRVPTMTMPHPMWSESHQLPLDLDLHTIGKLTQSTKHSSAEIYGAYKWVDKQIKHISQPIPEQFKVT